MNGDEVEGVAVKGQIRVVCTLAATLTIVVADVTEVEFMDSTMLRELLRCHRELDEAGSRLVVAGAQSPVRRLLELTGTDEVLALADSRADALA